jgi:hypothetical protein
MGKVNESNITYAKTHVGLMALEVEVIYHLFPTVTVDILQLFG